MSDDIQKNKKTVNNIYAALIVTLIFQFAPNAILQALAIVGFLIVFVWCYLARKKFEPTSLVANHTTYIIRSIWVFSFLCAIGFIICSIWLYFATDRESLEAFAQAAGTSLSQGTPPDLTEDYVRLVESNFRLITMATVLTLGPSIVYLGYRVVKGAYRGIKGYRIDNPKAWL